MVDVEAKAELLRRRVAALALPEGAMREAEEVVAAAGMRLPGAAEELRKEWLNDMVASTDAAEFRHASRDPGRHFVGWASERAKNRFHVTWRAVDAVARRLGADVASRLILVVWPQEIAWAQRMRLSENPVIATKAAMFLRETEGGPAKTFSRIADIYSEAAVRAGYLDSPAQDLSPSDIRFGASLPDFNPLFLRYAARSYAQIVGSMPRDKLEKLAARAARDERHERAEASSASAVASARRFPMRRMLSTVTVAAGLGLSSNELVLAEEAFLARAAAGRVEIDEGGRRSLQSAFVAAIADPLTRAGLFEEAPLPDFDESQTLWEIANMDRRWLAALPESYSKWSHRFATVMESWQSDIVHGRREAPYDPVCDFGFQLATSGDE